MIEFRSPMTVSLLSQRRATSPFGLHGGGAARPGAARLSESDEGLAEELGPCFQREVQAGHLLIIETPGGGGWGKADD